MQHFSSLADINLPQSWATIGTFDGVHRGHQAILSNLASAAHAAGVPAVVVTFFPNPIQVLRNLSEPVNLTTPDERAALMGGLGIDVVVTLTFDRALAALSAEEFMRLVCSHLGLRQLWVGSDFALGRNRQGDLPTLRALGEGMGYTVRVIPDVTERLETAVPPPDATAVGGASGGAALPAERISSSLIRALVRRGEVAAAARMLGRHYRLSGLVIHGEERGRELGFPTANVDYWQGKIAPAFGVYATWCWVGGRRLPSVTSVGVRPTFDPPITIPRVEAFLIDFEGDLYGQEVGVDFVEFLRPELKFSSAQALIDQMQLDTRQAREVLSNAP